MDQHKGLSNEDISPCDSKANSSDCDNSIEDSHVELLLVDSDNNDIEDKENRHLIKSDVSKYKSLFIL